MAKQLPKHKWLKLVVEHMQSHGAVKFDIKKYHDHFSVVLVGSLADGTEVMRRTLHRCRTVIGENHYSIHDRLRIAYHQYNHWLSWVRIVHHKEGVRHD